MCECADGQGACRARRTAAAAHPMRARAAPSTIPGAGLGLFAERPYRAREFVTYYTGVHPDDPDREGDRVLSVTARRCVDAADGTPCRSEDGRGDYVNHHADPARRNCRYVWDRTVKAVKVVTTRRVPQHAEFFADYGPWFRLPGR
jgi:hypothetical protein